MKAPSVCLLLGSAVLLFGLTESAVLLNVSPNRQLFLRRESISLSCVDHGQTVDGWTVRRMAGGRTQTCGGGQQDFGRINATSCTVSHLSPSDDGVYWCETTAGQRSVQVNISVTGRSVILELPKLPVIAGSDVTLLCKTRDSSTETVYFFRNGSFLGTGFMGEFTISDVQRSHEGLYWCSTGVFSGSLKSWLSVRDPDSPPPSPPSRPPTRPPTPSVSVVGLLCHLVVICPYCISTVLMVSIYCSKRTGNTAAVSIEMGPSVGGGQGLAEEYDVSTEHDF